MPMPVYSLDQCVSQALNVEIGDDEIPDGSKLQVRVSHVIEKLNFGSFLSNIPCGLQFVCLINQSNQWHCVNIKHCLSCIHCHLIINWGNCVSSAMMHLESPVVHIASLAVYLCGVFMKCADVTDARRGDVCWKLPAWLMLCSITQHTVLTAMIYSVPSNPKPEPEQERENNRNRKTNAGQIQKDW